MANNNEILSSNCLSANNANTDKKPWLRNWAENFNKVTSSITDEMKCQYARRIAIGISKDVALTQMSDKMANYSQRYRIKIMNWLDKDETVINEITDLKDISKEDAKNAMLTLDNTDLLEMVNILKSIARSEDENPSSRIKAIECLAKLRGLESPSEIKVSMSSEELSKKISNIFGLKDESK